ncbi:pyridoxamine 5'-phosphate oxidase family protein [Erythrobacter sp. SCSIO 43205]|uniref:pyridoxamine 5'-phosphate oxidase family protein n=1 Tax=Erythrobacter sp. SCSIO 43205 TaxID=2779361 RepID=UPI001CA9911F|nr:pyridoxamine 5'-phosphate oxidase family protein [Erythrobacter sp. SCSIO 43205]UAB79541.1 pyridoxamine 5'-phosphate oxidase family protein [Erythrobacter sp. SCSIO 43205]
MVETSKFQTLEDVREDLSRRLVRAARDRRSPMHVPAVITSDVDARTMVLREFNSRDWALRFHTDTRAPKVAAINADPRMAVLFYDKGAKVQIRVKGTGRVLADGPLVQEAWDKGTNFARRCYLGDGPGALSDEPTSGLPPEFEGHEPTDEQLVPARENFAILMVDLEELDWLYLAHTGHVRAQFTRDDRGKWQGRWVSP